MKSMAHTLRMPRLMARFFEDRLMVTLLAAVTVLALADAGQAQQSLHFVVSAMLSIAPYFLLAIGLAAYTKASGADKLIARAFSGNLVLTILAASLAGALSPFCSCGVIPIIAAMLASGVPLAPVLAFCVSSPIMDPEMFILTAAAIGWDFAAAKTVAAFGMGLMAGAAVVGFQKTGRFDRPLKETAACGCGRPTFDPAAPVIVQWRIWQDPALRGRFSDAAVGSGVFLGRWMMVAFFIESLMLAYVPAEWIGSFAGGNSAAAIPLSALVGIPAYMNGYAAIPLVSGLLEMGMSPGAALAFATAGAVSSVPAALAVHALVRPRVFWLYIAIGLAGSVLSGYGFQAVLTVI